jgi:hypothetical protein
VRLDQREAHPVGQLDQVAGGGVVERACRVVIRADLDHPRAVVERGREVDGHGTGVATRSVHGGGECAGRVHDEQVAGREELAELRETRVLDAARARDEQPDAVTHGGRPGRLEAVGQGERLHFAASGTAHSAAR